MTTRNEIGTNGAGDRGSYYYVNGQRVGLQREPRVFAVRYRGGKNSRSAQLSPRAMRVLQDESENIGFIPNYGLQLYATEQAMAARAIGEPEEEEALKKVRSLDEESAVEMAAMAYRRHADRSSTDPTDLMFVTREFVVQFKPEVTRAQIDAVNGEHGVRLVKPAGYAENAFVLEAPQTEGDRGPVVLSNLYFESGLAVFANPNFVRYRHLRAVTKSRAPKQARASAEPRTATSERTERSVFLDKQWHLDTAKVVDAWNVTRGSSTINVAILDDGVDLTHPEFAGKITAQYDFASGNADGSPNTGHDNHGTACAGVAVARGAKAFGAAPGCSLMAVRTPDYLGVADEAEMFRWTADNGADIISCSWGPADGTGAVDPLPDAVRAAIHYCVTKGRGGKGIPVFWAAGNGNESVSNDGYAANPEVMAIAASSSKERRSWYSDFGPEIFICAPSNGSRSAGELSIFTADRQGSTGYNPDPHDGSLHPSDTDYTDDFGGTSSATPLVAGIAGLILSIDPTLTVSEVRAILKDTADKIDSSGGAYDGTGHSANYGFGRVNALKAVERARDGAGGASTSTLSITAPESISRTAGPPTFQIQLGGRSMYAVEVAVRADLFDAANHGSERNDDTFYGSWAEGLRSDTPFVLPTEVWNRLKAADQLYYRLHVADDTSWNNHSVTVGDADSSSAPSTRIEGGTSTSTSTVSIVAPASMQRSAGPPTFEIQKGGRRYYAVEVAIRSAFFNYDSHGALRNEGNFYGSWEAGLKESTPYVLPEAVWDRLKTADQLFYRLHVADDESWSNYDVSTADESASSAPHIALGGAAASEGGATASRTVTFPSGATFTAVDSPSGGVDYTDHVGGGAVPLIEVRTRMSEKLSANFDVREFACRDQSPYARISPDLVDAVQRIRDRVGGPVTVNSAYRHPAFNTAVAGLADSYHIAGRAVSLFTSAMTPLQLAEIAIEVLGCDIGLGLGANSLHLDLRGRQATWCVTGATLSEAEFEQFVNQACAERRAGRRVRSMEPTAVPIISGPERADRQGLPPEFRIELGGPGYFAVELAILPELFEEAHRDLRVADTFYASWESVGLTHLEGVGTYQPPMDVWHRLRTADRLFYRIVASSRPDGWTNVRYSTADAEADDAPWIRLTGDGAGRSDRTVDEPGVQPLDIRSARRADESRWRE